MELRKPNLFVVGAMKSGTTYLHSLLEEHPEICMSKVKEPCYFVDPKELKKSWRSMWNKGFWKSEALYLDLFDVEEGHVFVGESSAEYTKAPKISGVYDRIYRYNRESRIIYVMRDPIQRTVSHCWHDINVYSKSDSILEMVKRDPQYVDVSNYVFQIEPYFRLFGRESVLLLTFEELTRHPDRTIKRVFDWLGVDSDFVPMTLHEPKNVTPKVIKVARGTGMLNAFRHSRIWNAIGGKVPPAIRGLARRAVETEIVKKVDDFDAVRSYLTPLQLEQTERLVELAGREFPEWTTLYARN